MTQKNSRRWRERGDGSSVVRSARAAGSVVFGTHRSAQRAEALRARGVTPLAPRVFDADEVQRALDTARPDVVIHQRTALPKELDPRAMAKAARRTAALRRQTVPLFARLSARAGARFIAQSMSFITRPEGAAVLDETAPLWLDGPRDSAETNDAIRTPEDATLQAWCSGMVFSTALAPGTHAAARFRSWCAGGCCRSPAAAKGCRRSSTSTTPWTRRCARSSEATPGSTTSATTSRCRSACGSWNSPACSGQAAAPCSGVARRSVCWSDGEVTRLKRTALSRSGSCVGALLQESVSSEPGISSEAGSLT